MDTKGQVKFSVEETDRVLGVHIIGASSKLPFDGRVIKSLTLSYLISGLNASEVIGEVVLALEWGASSEDITRRIHAHVHFYSTSYIFVPP